MTAFRIFLTALALSAGLARAAPDADTAFIEAALIGDLKSLDRQLQRGANINATNQQGMSALHIAATVGHTQAIAYLLGKGTNPELRSQNGNTAAQLAELMGHKQIAQMLKDPGTRARPTPPAPPRPPARPAPVPAAEPAPQPVPVPVPVPEPVPEPVPATVPEPAPPPEPARKPVPPIAKRWTGDTAPPTVVPGKPHPLAVTSSKPDPEPESDPDGFGVRWFETSPEKPRAKSAAVVHFDTDRIRAEAAQALRGKFPDLDLNRFAGSGITYHEQRGSSAAPLQTTWLGKDALRSQERNGAMHREVHRLKVGMNNRGEVLSIERDRTWLPVEGANPASAAKPVKPRNPGVIEASANGLVVAAPKDAGSARRLVDAFEANPQLIDLTMHKYALLERPEVQRELGLDAATLQRIEQAFVTPASGIPEFKEFMEAQQKKAAEPGVNGAALSRLREETISGMGRLTSRFHEVKLREMLNANQRIRLSQLLIQMRGPMILSMVPDTAERIGLAEEILDGIVEVINGAGPEITRLMSEYRKALSANGGKAGDLPERIRKIVRNRDVAILARLSEEQQRGYYELEGTPLPLQWDPKDFDRIPYRK